MLKSWFRSSFLQDLAGAWVPAYRNTGSFVEDLSPYRQNAALLSMDPNTDWITRDGVPCLDFDNTNDQLTLGNLPHFSTAGDATVLAFLRTNAQASGTVNSYWASYNTSSPYQGFGLDCGGNAISTGQAIWDGASWKDSSASTTAAATWQLVGASMRGTACTFYANGKAAGTTTLSTRGTWTGEKSIGPAPPPFASTFTGTLFNGQIGFVFLWQRTLQPTEITEFYTLTRQEFWLKRKKSAVVRGASLNNYSLTADVGSFTLSGQSAGVVVARSLVASQGSFSLAGQAAGLYHNRVLTSDVGLFSLSGQDASLVTTRYLTADYGGFSISGQDAVLLVSRTIAADQGSFSVSGQDALLSVRKRLQADYGSFVLTGQDASLTAARIISSDHGSFVFTGQDASLNYSQSLTLVAASGSFSLTGQDASLLTTRILVCGEGAFVLSGQDATLLRGRGLVADQGSFALEAKPATLTRTIRLAVDSASFVLTGQSVTLTYSGGGFVPAPYYYQMMMGV